MISPLKAGRALVALAVFGLALEGWARVDDYLAYRASLTRPYNNEILYTRDSVGRVGVPHARYRKWGLNSRGFRGPEYEAGKLTILVFGASETFGLYEDEGREYPRQIEDSLNARLGRDTVQVVNAAYPGESAYAHLVRAPELLEQFKPRIVVIYPTPADYIWLPYLRPVKRNPNVARTEKFEWRIGDRLRTFAKSVLPGFVQTRLRARETRASVRGFAIMDTLPDTNVVRFRSDITRLVELLAAHGVQPVIATHASLFSGSQMPPGGRDQLVAWRKFYPMLRERGFVHMEHRFNDELRAIARNAGVPLIDAAAAIPTTGQVFADFVHFTNTGATLMAQVMTAGLFPVVQQSLTAPQP